ncbi:polysaccharide biosynthesis tyrosine autokinase [Photobacterium sp. DA100]|uniref:polysaccharide biosynthesis tyrosine autokinase n=1 Tax=Photobacterium sp. DA100 TaxID=3027472 RepID=UPI00247AF141|nr:polysaccharide biosynthesis tyrosine autokinase [Photobacterium sp. DA100]WEM41578.1 polysaccharide biosynthesis tyrosine autokinase [Photobacterium sp. DA100]
MTTTQIINNSQNDSDEIDLVKLFGVLLDHRWIIILTTFVFASIGVVYALLATPIYKADALVQVEEKSPGVPGLSDISEMFASESSADTEIQIIKSRMVIGSTVDKLNLTVNVKPKYLPVIGKGLARLKGEDKPLAVISKLDLPHELMGEKLVLTVNADESYSLSFDGEKLLDGRKAELAQFGEISILISDLQAEPETEFTVVKRARLVTISELQEAVTVSELGKKTGILKLTLEGEEPAEIQAILNSITEDYLMQNIDRTSAEAEKSLQFLRGHLPDIKQQLDESEAKLNAYKLENDSVDLALEAKSVLDTMVTVEAQLNELTFKESDIAQRFTKSHPAYVSLLEKRRTLEAEKARIDRTVSKMPKTQQEVIRLSRDVEVNQAIYLQLVNKVQELNVMKASAVGNVRILDNAETLEEAVKPKKAIIVIIATMLGGVLSVAFALVKQAFHRGVENPDEIEAIGLPVYASVPMSDWQIELEKKQKGKKQLSVQDTLLAVSNPADLSIEALRSLRTSLHFAMMEAKNNILMISGPSPGIGKSFVSANMAAVVAKSGQKVLVIDADMRKGRMEKQMAVNPKPGLSDFLSGQTSIENLLKKPGVDGMDFIGRGEVPPNPSELLMHPRFKQLMDWASENYDIVIVDTPPILAVTDPAIVGAHAGTTLLVGRFGQNAVKEIEVTKQRFEQNGIEVKGFILNAVVRKASSYYGGNYGYYNYSYSSEK